MEDVPGVEIVEPRDNLAEYVPTQGYSVQYLDIPVEDVPGVEIVEPRNNLAEYVPTLGYSVQYLDIPVEDVPGVEVVEPRHNLAEYVAGQRLLQARVPDHQTKPPPQPTSLKVRVTARVLETRDTY